MPRLFIWLQVSRFNAPSAAAPLLALVSVVMVAPDDYYLCEIRRLVNGSFYLVYCGVVPTPDLGFTSLWCDRYLYISISVDTFYPHSSHITNPRTILTKIRSYAITVASTTQKVDVLLGCSFMKSQQNTWYQISERKLMLYH